MKNIILVISTLFITSVHSQKQFLYDTNHKLIKSDFKDSDKEKLSPGVYYVLKDIKGKLTYCKLIVTREKEQQNLFV